MRLLAVWDVWTQMYTFARPRVTENVTCNGYAYCVLVSSMCE